MQLILNNQIRWKQVLLKLAPSIRVNRSVEAFLVPTIHFSKQRTTLADPGQVGKFIDCGYEEAREAAIQRFVNRDNRKVSVALKVAIAIHAHDFQIGWVIGVRKQVERCSLEFLSAPRTCLKRNRGWFLIIVLERDCLRASRFSVVVSLLSHAVRCSGLPDGSLAAPGLDRLYAPSRRAALSL